MRQKFPKSAEEVEWSFLAHQAISACRELEIEEIVNRQVEKQGKFLWKMLRGKFPRYGSKKRQSFPPVAYKKVPNDFESIST